MKSRSARADKTKIERNNNTGRKKGEIYDCMYGGCRRRTEGACGTSPRREFERRTPNSLRRGGIFDGRHGKLHSVGGEAESYTGAL